MDVALHEPDPAIEEAGGGSAVPENALADRHRLEHRARIARVEVVVAEPFALPPVDLDPPAEVSGPHERMRLDAAGDRFFEEASAEELHGRGGGRDADLAAEDGLDVVMKLLEHLVELGAVLLVVGTPGRIVLGQREIVGEFSGKPEALRRFVERRRDELVGVKQTPAPRAVPGVALRRFQVPLERRLLRHRLQAVRDAPDVEYLDRACDRDDREAKAERIAVAHEPRQKKEVIESAGVVRVDVMPEMLFHEKRAHEAINAPALPEVALAPVPDTVKIEKWIVSLAVVETDHERAREARPLRGSVL